MSDYLIRDNKGISLKLPRTFWIYWFRSTGSIGLWRGARLVKPLRQGRV